MSYNLFCVQEMRHIYKCDNCPTAGPQDHFVMLYESRTTQIRVQRPTLSPTVKCSRFGSAHRCSLADAQQGDISRHINGCPTVNGLTGWDKTFPPLSSPWERNCFPKVVSKDQSVVNSGDVDILTVTFISLFTRGVLSPISKVFGMLVFTVHTTW